MFIRVEGRINLKRIISILLSICLICATMAFSVPVRAETVIEKAIAWAIATAEDDSHGTVSPIGVVRTMTVLLLCSLHL